ncbi:pyruvate decarboxylase [Fusarium oxysporum f. sp. melonis 26406]|uniref:Pyruvate decarboxylase n=1 Tax=Fusarium oxysporum f. sp. melonis 26406 TaxID=1089452 RepID=W9YZZ0_FUSOX|nr:pyruvate decarboxylase [Fusarium oxysporum f. sp. melonis 26406]
MSPFTVGDYLAERLVQIGIRHHFIVPGDYNLILRDKLEAHPSLTEIGCTNELNCSLAAEGYARANGIGVCIVTYSVGAFSTFNGIGSAYAERLPLILLEMARKITCFAARVRQALNAPGIIDTAIRAALTQKKPVYIEVPVNLAGETCLRPGPITSLLTSALCNQHALDVAVSKSCELIGTKHRCIILVGPLVRRAKAQDALLQLAEAIGCAVVIQPAAKGSFPEDHAQFAGMFWGQVSTLAADAIVNWADLLICIGTVFTDYSTVGWTALPSVPQLVVDMNNITVASKLYCSLIEMHDFLSRLAATVGWNDTTMIEYNRLRPDPSLGKPSRGPEKLTRKEIARQTQALLSLNPDTTVFADTGDSWFNGLKLSLPFGAEFEIEMQWGHPGWSIPASFGYNLARPQRQIIVMVGDGAFQMTAQEVSQMVRYRVPIIILLMNNRGYTIEVEIHDGLYNRVQNWDYGHLVEAFSCEDEGKIALGLEARTSEELSNGLERAVAHTDGPTLINYGSLSSEGAASYGFTIHQNNVPIFDGSGRLGPAEVFDAEATGALEGLKAALNLQGSAAQTIFICLDNLAVATCLRGTPSDSSQDVFLEFQALAASHGATQVPICQT